MFMITRRQLPVKQNPQSFLHCRKIAENRRKTQKRCNFNLQTGCGFKLPQSKPDGFASSLWEGAFGMTGKFAAQVQSGLPGVPLPSCRCAAIHLPQGDGFSGGGKVVGIAQRRPLGGAGERSETEGVLGLAGAAPHPATFPRRGKASAVAETSPVSPEAPSQRELARRKPRLREFFPLKKYAKNSAFRRVL